MSDPLTRPRQAVVEEHRAHLGSHLGSLLQGIGVLLFGIAALALVIWLMVADVQAKPFDSDGVRCYYKGPIETCIKTAEPAR